MTETRVPARSVPAGDPIGQAHSLYRQIEETKAQTHVLWRDFRRLRRDFEQARTPTSREEILARSPYARLLARLETMPVIEQAKGIIMAQSRCGDAQAFDILRRASQRSNVPVRELAARIVASTTGAPALDKAKLDGRGPGMRNRRPLWPVAIVRAMTRIPYLPREELGPEGQQLWDAIVDGRSDLVVTAEGGLAGPFNAFVTAPGAGRRLSSLGAKLRFGTSIERRLSEIAIITVGARWQAEFEWWAHAAMAREHGVADAVVDAIGRGEDPPFEADDERAVHAVARQLSLSGRLDQEAYDAAHRYLGDTGMVELVSLCGYYTLISFLLNAFAVPLPPGAAPMWAQA